MTKLAGLTFKLHYKKGIEKKVADALSRIAHGMSCSVISAVTPIWLQEVIHSYEQDPDTRLLLQELAVSAGNSQGYSLKHGLIYKKHQLYVGQNTAIQTKTINAFHASALGGHLGVQTTYQRVKELFYWPGLKRDVQSFVQQSFVNKLNMNCSNTLDYYSHYPFQITANKIFLWILLRDYQNLRAIL